MATIDGPKVQMPSTLAQMFETGPDGSIRSMKPEWAQFFHALQGIVYNESRSGPSSSRPTSTTPWRYIGMPYYDTSLSTSIFLESVNPDRWTGHYDTHKSSSQTFTSTVLQNDSDILIPMQAHDHFVGRIFVDCGDGLRATGIKVALTAPTGATGTYIAGMMLDSVGSGDIDTLNATSMGQTLDFTAAGINTATKAMMEIAFQVTNSTTVGSMHLQFAQSTASSTPITVRTATQIAANKIS